MTTFFVSFLLSFAAAVILTPVMILAARRLGVVDTAGASHRKIHAADIPRLGGAAIVLSFYVPLAALQLLQWSGVVANRVGDRTLEDPSLLAALLIGGACIAALGLYDDLKQVSPRFKLAVQISVAAVVADYGNRIERLDLPFLPIFELGWFAIPLTVFWIVGVTNAVNLIDGLDGLAAGIALFGLAPMVVLAVSKGNIVLALLCCSLAGSVLGFLIYNFHPARIFMGDTGSMFLGFVLAVVSVSTAQKGRVAVAMLTPILALGLPILDTLLAIARRAWMGQSLFVGDRQHIHHRLMATGMSHRTTVLVMYAFAGTFATLGVMVHFNRDRESALLFLLSMVVAGVLLNKVGYLVMPTGEQGVASAIRERNRLVRETNDAWTARLTLGRDFEALAQAASEIAFAAGARQARLSLAEDGQPVRTWAWDDSPAEVAGVDQAFSLQDLNGHEHGTLSVEWPDDGTFNEAVLPAVETGVRKLAEQLAAGKAARKASQA